MKWDAQQTLLHFSSEEKTVWQSLLRALQASKDPSALHFGTHTATGHGPGGSQTGGGNQTQLLAVQEAWSALALQAEETDWLKSAGAVLPPRSGVPLGLLNPFEPASGTSVAQPAAIMNARSNVLLAMFCLPIGSAR
jgi:hypothetical protein